MNVSLKPDGVSTSTYGAISEYKVCCDLLAKGYDVFRATSPACSCDLIARSKDGKLQQIEVRSANMQGDEIRFPRSKVENFDLYAIVSNGNIEYISVEKLPTRAIKKRELPSMRARLDRRFGGRDSGPVKEK